MRNAHVFAQYIGLLKRARNTLVGRYLTQDEARELLTYLQEMQMDLIKKVRPDTEATPEKQPKGKEQ